MITQELKLYDQPTYTKPVQQYNGGYNMYQSKKEYTNKEIKEAIKLAKEYGIKVGQKYRHANSTSNYFCTIVGWDTNPTPNYYNADPQVIRAKGNHPSSMECGYSLNELIKMEKIDEN
jgi:hypothetical protein